MTFVGRFGACSLWAVSVVLPGAAQSCEDADAFVARAYALSSPLDVTSDGPLQAIETRFGEALPVVSQTPDTVKLCYKGSTLATASDQLAVSDLEETLKFHNNVYEAERPSLGFWRNLDDMIGHLSFAKDRNVQPNWREYSAKGIATPTGFPILQTRQVETQIGKYIAVQILLPLSGEARNAYREHIEKESQKRVPTVVFDASLSAAEFLPRIWQDTRSDVAFGRIANAPIRAIAIMGDGSYRTLSAATLDELTSLEPPLVSGNETPMPKNAVYDALSASDTSPKYRNGAIWAFLGGDVDLSLPDAYRDTQVTAFQITPELDPELERSVESDRGHKFHPFTMDHTQQFLDIAGSILDIESGASASDDLDAVAVAQGKMGFLPFLPNDPDTATDIFDVDDAENWVAIPVWTVRNATVFE